MYAKCSITLIHVYTYCRIQFWDIIYESSLIADLIWKIK